jgi:hypothetical protein
MANSTSTNSTSTRLQVFRGSARLALAYALVALLLLAGVQFLYEGLGLDFRVFDYPILKPIDLPIGLLLLGLGMATARFWIFKRDREDRSHPPAT